MGRGESGESGECGEIPLYPSFEERDLWGQGDKRGTEKQIQ
jgi:hypothetical protein